MSVNNIKLVEKSELFMHLPKLKKCNSSRYLNDSGDDDPFYDSFGIDVLNEKYSGETVSEDERPAPKYNLDCISEVDAEILSVIENFYDRGIDNIAEKFRRLKYHESRFIELIIITSLFKDRGTAQKIYDVIPILFSMKLLSHIQIILAFEKVAYFTGRIESVTPYSAIKIFSLINYLIEKGCLYREYLEMIPEYFSIHVLKNYKAAKSLLSKLDSESDDANDLKHYIKLYTEESKNNHKMLQYYKIRAAQLTDLLYGENDADIIMQFFVKMKAPSLCQELMYSYIVRAIMGTNSDLSTVSRVLEDFYADVLSNDTIEITFFRILVSIREQFYGNEIYEDMLRQFLTRSVVDYLITPSYLKRLQKLHTGGAMGIRNIARVREWIKIMKRNYDQTKVPYVVFIPEQEVVSNRMSIYRKVMAFMKGSDPDLFMSDIVSNLTERYDMVFMVMILVKKAAESARPELVPIIGYILLSLAKKRHITIDIIKRGIHNCKKHLPMHRNECRNGKIQLEHMYRLLEKDIY